MASFNETSRYNALMQSNPIHHSYQQARFSRDARFDGRFFVAVKTTGIYCRSICPATSPKEENIEYYSQAHLAAKAGYRPCLRCHPDSAPGSPIWNGVDTTLRRAREFIDNGFLEQGTLTALAARLGISDRYLRQLFDKHLGVSPKSYALFRQCEFAKKLLHQTTLPITEIAFASGFNSIRRFNDCFKKQLSLSPSQVRHKENNSKNTLELKLYYRPPYNWQHLQRFFSTRLIEGLEWCDTESYGRTFHWQNEQGECHGSFTAKHNEAKHRFDVSIEISQVRMLKAVVNNIRRVLDLDADTEIIERCLIDNGFTNVTQGLRLPGTWSVFEAGIRAILGQQISVTAARKLVTKVTYELGVKTDDHVYFPSVKSMADSDFSFIKIPGKRKETLSNLARHFLHETYPNEADSWLTLKGIGPWTIDYAKMRGLSDPDIYLGGDLGVKKAIANKAEGFSPDHCAPFRSYLTFQLWNQLT